MVVDRVGVIAAGDPRSPRTWSGTPAALVQAFERLGGPEPMRVETLSGELQNRFDNVPYGAAGLVRGEAVRRFRHFWGYVHARDVRAWAGFRRAHPDLPVLHTDHMWLDPELVGAHDFIYRDSAWTDWATVRGLEPSLRNRVGDRYRRILQASGGVFATSESAKRELVSDGARPDSVAVVGTGVGNLIKPYDRAKNYARGRVLCVAKVREHDKGVDLVVEAFGLLQQWGRPWELDLVLGHPEPTPSSNIRTHHAVSGEKLIELFRDAALFVMPARNEPHGLVYLEALLSRTPIMGSGLAAFPEFAGDGARGFVVEQLTPRAVAEAIDAALLDPSALERKGQAGRAYAETFTWDNTAAQIWDGMRSN